MMELDLVAMAAGAVLSRTTGDVTGVVTAPARAAGKYIEERVLARLNRHSEQVEERSDGPVEAPDSIRVKAGVEAALRDDDVAHEYLAGVVAGARDDGPTSILAMVGRLSSLDLRLHYLLYRELFRLAHSPSAPMLDDIRDERAVARDYEMFVPAAALMRSLGLDDGPEASRQLLASLRALTRENLIAPFGSRGATWGDVSPAPGYVFGGAHKLSTHTGRAIPEVGLVVRPTVTGMSLIAWAFARDGTGDPASFIGLESIPCVLGNGDIGAELVTDLPEP